MAWTSGDGKMTIQHPDRFLIGGEWVASTTGRSFAHVDPATEEVLVHVAEAAEVDVDRAVAAAREAFDSGPWPRMTPRERAGYLKKLADLLRAHTDALGHAWTREMGVVYEASRHGGAGFGAFVDQHVGFADSFPWEESHPTTDGQGGEARIVREPVGVVAAIVPWNAAYPLALVKVIPALLAGCTVVLKAAPEGAIGPLVLMDLFHSLGLPPGVINFLTADRTASEHLVRHQGVDKVSFTGSTAAGKRIGSICAERVARCTLELGGKSAALIMDDYDIDAAADALTGSMAFMSNQVCAALSRVIVTDDRHDQLVAALSDRFQALVVGDPYDPATQMGPLAMERQLQRVEEYIGIGRNEARLITGGARPPSLNRGFFIQPTLFADVDADARIAQEEIFGPVVVVQRAASEEDAVRLANHSNFGLAGAVFTDDDDKAYRVSRRVRTGTMSRNRHRWDFGVSFGGFKQSGIGREGGFDGVKAFTEAKTLILDPA